MNARDDGHLATQYLQTALAALRNLPEASVLVFDEDMRYVLVAGQAVGQSGFDAGAMEGRSIAEVLPAERWALWEPFYRAALGGQSSSVEVQSAATSHWYRVDVGPLRDESGTVT
jgi:PAS domain-containing protein